MADGGSIVAVRPRTPLSRERIFDAAISLIDAEGLDALSMRKLGAVLGCEAMSLYKHVEDKGALLQGVRERLLGAVQAQGSGIGWRGPVLAVSRGVRRALAAHPNALALYARTSLGEAAPAQALNLIVRRMKEAGFGDLGRAHALGAIGAYTLGQILSRANDAAFEYGLDALLDGLEGARRRR